MLTKNEKMLIADALNGSIQWLDHDPQWISQMTGDDGALADAQIVGQDAYDRITLTGRVCSGLEHEIYDAIRLNRLDEKWETDGRALVNKIAAMTSAQREQLIRSVHAAWNGPDDQFTTAIEAIAL